MIVGFHAPLPPAPSGVADYADTLAEALKSRVAVAINPIEPCSVELYHLGNNQLHRAIYSGAMKRPGAVVLHDAVLHHFFLGVLPEEPYIEEFVYNYGEWGRELAQDLWRSRARSAQDPRYFDYPMLRRVGEVARAVIVHNPAAGRMVRNHAPSTVVVEIPHLYQAPAPADRVEIIRLRDRLGVRPSATLFGVFGFLRESKRLMTVLRAFSRVRQSVPDTALLLAGRFVSTDLKRAVVALAGVAGVHWAGYLPETEFQLHAEATDVCINLRYPAAGETSGIAIRMMGLAKTCLLTEGEETSRFPEGSCIRIDAGPAEEEMLSSMMLWVAEDRAACREIGRRAAAYIAEYHGVERCAAKYAELLQALPSQRVPRPRSIRAY